MGMILNLYRLPEPEAKCLAAEPETMFRDYEAVHSSPRFLDIDKSWHGLHFLYTGSDWEGDPPACFLLVSDDQFSDGFDYGGHLLEPVEVRAFAEFLQTIDEEALRSRFDPNRMTELGIYPDIWDRDPTEDDTLGYLVEYHGTLREFVAAAAEDGDAMLIWLA